jgi:hypothetical protein
VGAPDRYGNQPLGTQVEREQAIGSESAENFQREVNQDDAEDESLEEEEGSVKPNPKNSCSCPFSLAWDGAHQFHHDWGCYRDRFIMSLSGDSHDAPAFVWLDLVALAWEYEEGSKGGTAVEG